VSNKISVIIDVAVDKANAGLKGFKKSIDDASGAAGKFKAGASSAMSSVQANAGNLAMAGGAALVAFGAKAVASFQNTAIAAGKMADALGLPVETASRLIEVAGDLGIEAATLQSSIGKMNVTAGKTPGVFDDIGASIVRNKDGTMDVNATFLATVDALNAIPDAGDRAAASQQIFGKGYKEIAELVTQGSDQITASMAKVSDAKIIDEDEVRKARDLRAAQDELSDAIEDIGLAVGEMLVPALTDMAESFTGVYEVAKKLKVLDVASFIQKWLTPVNMAQSAFDKILPSYRNVTDAAWDYASAVEASGGSFDKALIEYEAMEVANAKNIDTTLKAVDAAIDHGDALNDFAEATEDSADATGIVTDAIQASIDAHNEEMEAIKRVNDARRVATNDIYAAAEAEDAWWQQVVETTAALEDAELGEREKAAATRDLATATDEAVTAQLTANGVNVDSVAGQQAWLDAMLASAEGLSGPMRDEVLRYIGLVTGIPAEQLTLIKPNMDFAALKRIEDDLNFTSRARDVRISPSGGVPRYASGTKNHPGGLAIVGEQGPELVDLPGGSAVHTAGETANMVGGVGGMGTTINITSYGSSDEYVRKMAADIQRILRESQ
jgi:hypothetical protein